MKEHRNTHKASTVMPKLGGRGFSLPIGHDSHHLLVLVLWTIDRDERMYTAIIRRIVSSFDIDFFGSPAFCERIKDIERTTQLMTAESTKSNQRGQQGSKNCSASRKSGGIRK